MLFLAINIGSIKVSFIQLMKGLFIEYNKDVASIYQIRFPRVIVTMLVGCALALSGLLFQVVLKNPLARSWINRNKCRGKYCESFSWYFYLIYMYLNQ